MPGFMKSLIFSLISLSICAVEIADWTNPSLEDFIQLQNYLQTSERPELHLIKIGDISRYNLIRKFTFVDCETTKVPQLEYSLFNTNPEDKKYCIITYSSCNKPYNTFATRLQKALYKTRYRGHFLYQIGGWPYIAEGGLHCFDVPYAFKICMFQEARKLGYRYVLWIDIAAIPHANLSKLFLELEQAKSVFLLDPVPFQKQKFFRYKPEVASLTALFNSTQAELKDLPHLNAKLIGLDLFSETHLALLDDWYTLAKQKLPFYSPVPEQLPLSYLVQKYNLTHTIHPEAFFYTYFNLLPHYNTDK